MITKERINGAGVAFYAELKQQRLKAGLSQAELGKLTGWNRRDVSSLELGKRNASLDTIHAYLMACGSSLKIISAK